MPFFTYALFASFMTLFKCIFCSITSKKVVYIQGRAEHFLEPKPAILIIPSYIKIRCWLITGTKEQHINSPDILALVHGGHIAEAPSIKLTLSILEYHDYSISADYIELYYVNHVVLCISNAINPNMKGKRS